MDRHLSLTTYDLVSRGAIGQECHGTWIDAENKGWGPGYQYACIHSGVIKTSGDLATNWYNYALATAGTIIDENTTEENPATNPKVANESICPKGWTLPTNTQIDSQKNIAAFSPVLGGNYNNTSHNTESTRGYWWGRIVQDDYRARRYTLAYDVGDYIRKIPVYRHNGIYIRCVQKST